MDTLSGLGIVKSPGYGWTLHSVVATQDRVFYTWQGPDEDGDILERFQIRPWSGSVPLPPSEALTINKVYSTSWGHVHELIRQFHAAGYNTMLKHQSTLKPSEGTILWFSDGGFTQS